MTKMKRIGAIGGCLAASISFSIIPTGLASAAGGFQLRNGESGQCLEIADWSSSNGAAARQWTCTSGANQKWIWDGTALKNANSGKCLEIADWSKSYGSVARQWECTGGANQRWSMWNNDNYYYNIQNVNSRLWLEIPGNSHTRGTQATQWGENGGYNQRWNIV
ncbi:RICIN domain-containing protein [Streptomyces erythrochromogenes]|uniref:RICIN domain-containing protein n=1 Tax=Streptomyces erythrochromogenes TaxID=285574 RepID=UPI0038151586